MARRFDIGETIKLAKDDLLPSTPKGKLGKFLRHGPEEGMVTISLEGRQGEFITASENIDHAEKLRWTVSVLLVCRDHALIVKHKALGYFVPVGGGIFADERPVEAAIREAREETGLHFSGVEHLRFDEIPIDGGARIYLNHTFIADVDSFGDEFPMPISDGTWDQYLWIDLLPKNGLVESPPLGTPRNVLAAFIDLRARRAPPKAITPEPTIVPHDPIPMLLTCPQCGQRHIDEGRFATYPHHTHACQHCGHVWKPAKVHTVGVRFLPGYKD